MLIKRRQFIESGSLATAGTLLIPKFLKATGAGNQITQGDKILVVIQLSGGNDGLNTVIPVKNDIYYRERPRLAIPANEALLIGEEAGLHPELTAFRTMYDQGELTIINGVGYPNPDRSHFRSMDIWHSASGSSQYWNSGWIGRYLDATCNGCPMPTQALEIEDILSLALKGDQQKGLALTDPKKLKQTAGGQLFPALLTNHEHDHNHEPMADYLYKTLADTLQSADYLQQKSSKTADRAGYPDSELGRRLRTVASLILGQANTKVYYTSLGSFDTHIGQEGTQARLFRELNTGVEAFVNDLKKENRFEDVLVVTFSEFGRRVAQNASGGTDHGTANNMFVIGKNLKKAGLYNPLSQLDKLQEGDLTHDIDFRNVYATLLGSWLNTDSEKILRGRFDRLNFV